MRFLAILSVVVVAGCGEEPRARSVAPQLERCTAPSPLYEFKQRGEGPIPELRDLVVTGVTDNGFFAQVSAAGCDAALGPRFSGVFVFTDAGPRPVAGEVVVLSNGVMQLFHGQRQIQRPTWSVSGRGSVEPAQVGPVERSGASPHEGVLVELRDQVVKDPRPSPGPADRAPDNELELESGLRIDDFLGHALPPLSAGARIARVVGVLAWRNGHLELGPRDAADVELEGACTPDCAGRSCGPDPRCGQPCGACEGRCEAGACVPASSGGEGPRILRLSISPATLERDRPLQVTVEATHPEGLDRLVGATVSDETGSYGALPLVGGGLFERRIAWEDAQRLASLQLGPEGTQRTLRVRVIDAAGREATAEERVTIRCGGGRSACDGQCADLSSDLDRCGRCDRRCTSALV